MSNLQGHGTTSHYLTTLWQKIKKNKNIISLILQAIDNIL